MKTVFIVILSILVLAVLIGLFAPKAGPSNMFEAACAPGYMPTGSGCVPTNEDVGLRTF